MSACGIFGARWADPLALLAEKLDRLDPHMYRFIVNMHEPPARRGVSPRTRNDAVGGGGKKGPEPHRIGG